MIDLIAVFVVVFLGVWFFYDQFNDQKHDEMARLYATPGAVLAHLGVIVFMSVFNAKWLRENQDWIKQVDPHPMWRMITIVISLPIWVVFFKKLIAYYA